MVSITIDRKRSDHHNDNSDSTAAQTTYDDTEFQYTQSCKSKSEFNKHSW